ncbi:hypothetical protein HMPREF9413_1964 [Paenibacillus sp. HGF7]|nr:hypothetical protein HMPREF9413_1964 [Paenibacillus sp. HGF7]
MSNSSFTEIQSTNKLTWFLCLNEKNKPEQSSRYQKENLRHTGADVAVIRSTQVHAYVWEN